MTTSTHTIFNPDDYFSFAGAIVRDPNANDAALRAAISRAYYAVFLSARDHLFGIDELSCTVRVRKKIEKNFQIKYNLGSKRPYLATHQRVIFSIIDKTNNVVLSQQLDQLREARVRADYKRNNNCLSEVNKQSWRDYAEETMQLAALVLPMTKRLPSYC